MTDKEKLDMIKQVIKIAEGWATEQEIPESQICMSALKDIRKVVNIPDEKESFNIAEEKA